MRHRRVTGTWVILEWGGDSRGLDSRTQIRRPLMALLWFSVSRWSEDTPVRVGQLFLISSLLIIDLVERVVLLLMELPGTACCLLILLPLPWGLVEFVLQSLPWHRVWLCGILAAALVGAVCRLYLGGCW